MVRVIINFFHAIIIFYSFTYMYHVIYFVPFYLGFVFMFGFRVYVWVKV